MIDVKEYFLKNTGKEERDSNPIILGILGDDLSILKQKHSVPDIKNSYRKLSMKYHPDKHINQEIGEQKKNAELFEKIHEIYSSLSEPGKFTQLPYAINSSFYQPLNDYEHERALESYWIYTFGEIFKCFREKDEEIYFSETFYDDLLKWHKIKNPAAVKEYIAKETEKKINEDLGLVEFTLDYGFFDDNVSSHIAGTAHRVAIKHLKKATNNFSNTMQKNEWIFVDRDLSIRNSVADIRPSTVVMFTDDNWLFVARYPYNKYMIPKDHALIPISEYPDASGKSLTWVEDNKLPMEEQSAEDIEKEMRFNQLYNIRHIPWVCLSPYSIKILNEYPFAELEENDRKQLSESDD